MPIHHIESRSLLGNFNFINQMISKLFLLLGLFSYISCATLDMNVTDPTINTITDYYWGLDLDTSLGNNSITLHFHPDATFDNNMTVQSSNGTDLDFQLDAPDITIYLDIEDQDNSSFYFVVSNVKNPPYYSQTTPSVTINSSPAETITD